MGQMKISEVQREMVKNAADEMARVEQQRNVILAAILAGGDIRVAQNVHLEGDQLVWDSEGGEAEGLPSEPTGPELHEATQKGDSDGPEVSAPEAEEKAESEATVEAPVG